MRFVVVRRVGGALVPALALALVTFASPAWAGDDGPALTAAEARAILTPADVADRPGDVDSADVFPAGRGAIPTACQSPTGRLPGGKPAPRTVMSEVDLSSGVVWQGSIFSYASGAAARASFDQLRTRGFALCRGEVFSPYGDDQADVPNVNAASARRWAPASGRTGFTTADSHILLEPESAPPGYQDDYTFSAFVLAGSGIVEVHLFSARPLEGSDRAAARRVADGMAGRFVG